MVVLPLLWSCMQHAQALLFHVLQYGVQYRACCWPFFEEEQEEEEGSLLTPPYGIYVQYSIYSLQFFMRK